MCFKCVTCYYEEGGLTQQQFWFAVLSTCQFLRRIKIAYVSVGRYYKKVVCPSFPGVLKTLWYHESSQICQPLLLPSGEDAK